MCTFNVLIYFFFMGFPNIIFISAEDFRSFAFIYSTKYHTVYGCRHRRNHCFLLYITGTGYSHKWFVLGKYLATADNSYWLVPAALHSIHQRSYFVPDRDSFLCSNPEFSTEMTIKRTLSLCFSPTFFRENYLSLTFYIYYNKLFIKNKINWHISPD